MHKAVACFAESVVVSGSAGKPGSDAAHYHTNQQEQIKVKQGRLGYYIGHHSHVQAAEAGEEVTIRPGKQQLLIGSAASGGMLPVLADLRPAQLARGEGRMCDRPIKW